MMKKLLAMLLAVLMLISACAVAEETFGGKLVVRDMVISVDGESALDLSGVDLTLAMAGDDVQSALRLAVDAAGANVLNAIAAFDAEKMTIRADGISDVYSLSYEDLIALIEEAVGDVDLSEAFMRGFETGVAVGSGAAEGEVPAEISALMEHATEILPNTISDGGTETIDGVEYAVMNIDISEEQMDLLLDDVAAIVDLYAADRLKDNGYDNCAQLFDEQQLRMSVDGEVCMSDAEIVASINVNAITKDETEPETLNIYVDVTEDAENGAVDVYGVFSEVDGEEIDEIGSFLATYTEADGEFAKFDLGIYDEGSNEASFYMSVSAPAAQDEGLWEFYLSIEDGTDTVSFSLDFGSVDSQNQIYAYLSANEQNIYLDYAGADGVGTLSIGVMDGEESVGNVSAIVELAADDGAWLPGAADTTVNMLTIDDAQMQKLSMEGTNLLMNALSGLSQANESLAAMIGSMME